MSWRVEEMRMFRRSKLSVKLPFGFLSARKPQ